MSGTRQWLASFCFECASVIPLARLMKSRRPTLRGVRLLFPWGATLATNSEDADRLNETHRRLRRAIVDCRDMLARAQEALRRSRQDNEPC
jgi:hypothetical protein